MIKKQTPDGKTYWEPQDPNDKGLLAMAEGATFGETIFPSGWKSPKGTQTARGGLLYETEKPPVEH